MRPSLILSDVHDPDGTRQQVRATINNQGGLRLRSRALTDEGLHEWVHDYTADQTDEVITLLGGDDGAHVLGVIEQRQADDSLPTPLHVWLSEQGLVSSFTSRDC